MARPEMEKKKVTLYLKTEQEVKRWRDLSKAAHTSISKWAQQMVDLGIENKENIPKITTRSIMELVETTEIFHKKKKNEEIEKLKTQLKEALESSGKADYERIEKSVIAILHRGEVMDGNEIKQSLKIDNEESLKVLNRVFGNLLDNEIIEELEGGRFRWRK